MTEQISEYDYQELFDNAPCGYVLVRTDGIILRANGWLTTLLGYQWGSLDGTRFRDILSMASRILYETNLAPLLTLQDHIGEVTLDLKRRDGSTTPVIMGASAVSASSDQPGTIRIAFVQAGERRLYERELASARDDAERGLQREKRDGKLREQFVAVLGHDLRNPLASIAAATRILEKEALSERGRQVVGLMKGSTSRMSGLIDNVLDFARTRLGGGIGIELRDEHALEPLIEQVVEELRAANPAREVQATYSTIGPVRCDSGRIGQLVSNLLGNALSHGDALKPVSLRAETGDDGTFRLWVVNGGSPIPLEVMETLFHPFVRGQAHGTAEGLGLGLYIAQEIAKAHGGTLTVTSTETETRFTCEIPGKAASI
ncbi:PAS domain-containing sensor histidine kinase [Aliirhizobium smilacinae]|uniref:histidine kinase n=1 Tax=Aliirhizobium smilacinae TaxID=1395944 RepID=A0A5C4XNZ2_9HYPH|nr:PAS domain-containing sensor histidine kinase [Rhizobium smilacinae]TNM65246.1 PAS domain S-box protein [Rhizobium smilacinae]